MAKIKKEKKKIPFNVMRKPLVSAILGVTMLAGSVGLLTGCSGEKGDTGASGKSAYELAVDNGFVGTVQEWLDSLKGDAGTAPTITIDPTTKHWLINGQDTGIVAEGQNGAPGAAGSKGDTGNGIENIDIVYEYDTDGKLWAIFTITYTESETPEIVRVQMPAKLESVFLIGETNFFVNTVNKPKLYLDLLYDDSSNERVELENSMITEGTAPNFAQAGEYGFTYSYNKKSNNTTINVIDPASVTITSVDDNTFYLKKGANLNTINNVRYTLNDSRNVIGQIQESIISKIYKYNETTENYTDEVQSVDSTTAGAKFKIETTTGNNLEIEVYDPAVTNVRGLSFGSNITFEWKDTDYLSDIIGKTMYVNFYEPVDGYDYKQISITAENLDTTNFNINKLGYQEITLKYEDYEEAYGFAVEPNLLGVNLTRTYTATDPMFTNFYGQTFEIYENGVAKITSSYGYHHYSEYDLAEIANGFFVIEDENMGGESYFKVETNAGDSTIGTIGYYVPDGTPSKVYSLNQVIEGDTYTVKLNVYGTTGECFATVIMPDMGDMHYSTIKVAYKDANTLTAFGKDYVVGTDLTDITPNA